MEEPKLSIIVPVYNAEKTIDKCINSILKQNYQHFELLLIDDGSNDLSGKICDEYAQNDKRIKVIHNENKGVSFSRNCGVQNSRGTYVQFIDSDDFIEPSMSRILVEKIEDSKADIVICGYNEVRIEVIEEHKCVDNFMTKEEFGKVFPELYALNFFNPPWNKLYKKNLIIEYFDETISIGEDLIFNLAYLKNAKVIAFINNCLYNYINQNNNSLSKMKNIEQYLMALKCKNEVLNFTRSEFNDEADISIIEHLFYDFITQFCYVLLENKSINWKKKREYINRMIAQVDSVSSLKANELKYKILIIGIKYKKPDIILYLYYIWLLKKNIR